MKLSKSEIGTMLGMWLIVVATVVLYVEYNTTLKTIGEIVVYSTPILFFGLVGSYVFNRDRQKIRKAKEINELTKTVELNWMTSLKHDLLTYLIPIIILLVPLLFGHNPSLLNIFASIITYLTLIYLKFIYWSDI